jgi:hypothetical protein
MYRLLFGIFLVNLLFVGCRKKEKNNNTSNTINVLESSTGNFEYTAYVPLENKPISIHFYIPNNVDRTSAPILFLFPGMNRNALDYLNTWTTHSEDKGVMIFSFEFSDYYYPGGNAYQQGYVFDDNGNLNDESLWSFSLVESVFDFIKDQLGYQYNSYDMFGHSGGAQFVHRYVIFTPNARINRAVAANSGWYTIPDTSILFPYGLESSSLNLYDIKSCFNHDLEIHLGQNDDNPDDPSLRVTAEANLQGSHRLERGRYFIDECNTLSNQYNSSSFNWVKKEVPNVGHQHDGMASFASDELY